MAKDVIMPALGMAQESGVLVRWLVAEGSMAIEGEPMMEVETDKAVVEVPAPATGTLSHVAFGEGDEVPIGTVLAVLLGEGEERAAAASAVAPASPHAVSAPPPAPASTPTPAGAPSPSSTVSPARTPTSELLGKPARDASPSTGATILGPPSMQAAVPSHQPRAARGASGRVLASPLAKTLARERGVSLAAVRGSGPEGAIKARDLDGHVAPLRAEQEGAVVPAPVAAVADASKDGGSSGWLHGSIDVTGMDAFLERVLKATQASRMSNSLPPRYASVDVLTRLAVAGLARVAPGWMAATAATVEVKSFEHDRVPRTAVLSGAELHSIADIASARALDPGDRSSGPPVATVLIVDRSAQRFETWSASLPTHAAMRFTLGPVLENPAVVDGEVRVGRRASLRLDYQSTALDEEQAASLFGYVSELLEDPFALAIHG